MREARGMSFRELGDRFGFAGASVQALFTGKNRMHSKHASRVRQALEALEVQLGFRQAAPLRNLVEEPAAAPSPTVTASLDLAAMIRSINAMGFSVELKPLA